MLVFFDVLGILIYTHGHQTRCLGISSEWCQDKLSVVRQVHFSSGSLWSEYLSAFDVLPVFDNTAFVSG